MWFKAAMGKDALFIVVLKRKFEDRVAGNRRYSLRAYARDLGVSVSLLSGLFNGKKGLSETTAIKICKCLGLSPKEAQEFLLSVTVTFARSSQKRLEALNDLSNFKKRQSAKTVLKDQSLAISANWVHLALLELCELADCEHKVSWFSRKLRIGEVAIARALKTLIDSNQLTFDGDRYVATTIETTTDFDIPSPVVRRFHSNIMDRAKESLMSDPVEKREFLSATLAFNDNDVMEAKEMIRQFEEQFSERFYRKSGKPRNSVYQFSLQLFPLTTTK